MRNDFPKYMTMGETLKYLNIKSYATLYKLIDDGLEVISIGRNKRISQEAADRYMDSKIVNKQY